MVEYGGVWQSMVEYGGVWWSMVEYGGVWYSMIEYSRACSICPGSSYLREAYEGRFR